VKNPPAPEGLGSASDPGLKLTYDDFLLFPDDGKRHELIDGEHYLTPSPNIRHQEFSGRLHLLIGAWLQTHPVGKIFYAPLDVLFSRFDVVEPDLLYVSNERAESLLACQHVTGAPDLVVEIASPGTRKRDETIKRRLYERSGVTEYWVDRSGPRSDSRVSSRGRSLRAGRGALQRGRRRADDGSTRPARDPALGRVRELSKQPAAA
jgi:Putative restriction endonuclease